MSRENDFRETLYTIDKRGNRKWVYPHFLLGRYFRARIVVGYLLMAFYLLMPWITVGDHQAVFLDIAHRRFVFFGLELWATDTIFLFLTLAILAMSLFFFTSLLGRIWCGWACPETVFLELLFRPIERLIEGTDSQRRKLDSAPWNANKIFKKLLKHALCAIFAWIIASTALAYFIGRETLITMMTQSPFLNLGPFSMTVALMGVMAFQFGWFREQFCTVLCPYARFQSVLMDQNSLLVGYDKLRGEPRGKLRKSDSNRGDCVDCGLCVKVCPTGIDIRNGTQLECIACTACIDACDSVMDKIGKPRGLIKYSSESALLNPDNSKREFKWFRPRVLVYSAILVILSSILFYQLSTRESVDMEIVRAISPQAFTIDSNNIVTNQFSLRVANKGKQPVKFEFKIKDPSSISFVSPIQQISFNHGQAENVPLFIRAPLALFNHGTLIAAVEIISSNGAISEYNITLMGPDK